MGFDDLGSFVEAAEKGSLTAAARALGVPKSTISRRIARLEEELGQELVRRSAHVFRLTEAGEALYARSAPALRDLGEAVQLVRDAGTEPSGVVKISAPLDVGSSVPFVRMLVAFRAAYPKVKLTVDLSDRFVDIVAEGYDLALRLHAQPLDDRASWMTRRLGAMRWGLYASRAYLERRGAPSHPEELVNHDVISIVRSGVPVSWPLRRVGTDDKPEWFEVPVTLGSTSLGFVASGIEADGGIGMLPELVAIGLLARAPVERVLTDWEMPSVTMSLLWPASRHLSPRVRAFLDFAVEHLPAGRESCG